MPEMSGVNVAMQLRTENPALPVIFLTGHEKGEAAKMAASIEQCLLFEKPPVVSKLAAAIHQLIECRKS